MTKTCYHLKKWNIMYFVGMLFVLQKVTKRYTQIQFFSPKILLHHLGSEGRVSYAIKLTSVSHMLINYLHPSSAFFTHSHSHSLSLPLTLSHSLSLSQTHTHTHTLAQYHMPFY